MFPQPNSRLTRQTATYLSSFIFLLFLAVPSLRATEIAIWNFNDSDLGADLMTDDRADWTTLGAVAEVLLG